MKYIISMPDKWESPDGQSYDCAYCPFCLNDLCGNRFDGCTLLNAKKAVEVSVCGIGTGVIPKTSEPTFMYKDKSPQAIGKPVKIYAVDTRS